MDDGRLEAATAGIAHATFGAGCFWGVEAEFRNVPGVMNVTAGYAGGHTANPSYRDVCGGRTGHAEVVDVVFDPSRVSYGRLLDAFWQLHDPTANAEPGSQYRSVIFYHTERQRAEAEASKAALEASGTLDGPIATEIVPAQPFTRAEEYHQRYYQKNGIAH